MMRFKLNFNKAGNVYDIGIYRLMSFKLKFNKACKVYDICIYRLMRFKLKRVCKLYGYIYIYNMFQSKFKQSS